jgi:hypothetical protein
MVFISDGSLLVVPSESVTYFEDNFLLISTRKAGGCFFKLFDCFNFYFIRLCCRQRKDWKSQSVVDDESFILDV